MFLGLTLGGLIQGFALFDPGVNFMSSVFLVAPFRVMNALGALVLFAGTVAFANGFIRNLLDVVDVSATPPVRSTTIPEAASV
jgi:hypothetical protein